MSTPIEPICQVSPTEVYGKNILEIVPVDFGGAEKIILP